MRYSKKMTKYYKSKLRLGSTLSFCSVHEMWWMFAFISFESCLLWSVCWHTFRHLFSQILSSHCVPLITETLKESGQVCWWQLLFKPSLAARSLFSLTAETVQMTRRSTCCFVNILDGVLTLMSCERLKKLILDVCICLASGLCMCAFIYINLCSIFVSCRKVHQFFFSSTASSEFIIHLR